jgi:hypothetical protein
MDEIVDPLRAHAELEEVQAAAAHRISPFASRGRV